MKERLIAVSHAPICQVRKLVVPDGVVDDGVEHLERERVWLDEALAGWRPHLLARAWARHLSQGVADQLQRLVVRPPKDERYAGSTPQPQELNFALGIGPMYIGRWVDLKAQGTCVLGDVPQQRS
eukprot:1412365-Prymnesium_polylepis.2